MAASPQDFMYTLLRTGGFFTIFVFSLLGVYMNRSKGPKQKRVQNTFKIEISTDLT